MFDQFVLDWFGNVGVQVDLFGFGDDFGNYVIDVLFVLYDFVIGFDVCSGFYVFGLCGDQGDQFVVQCIYIFVYLCYGFVVFWSSDVEVGYGCYWVGFL